jgi:hypothetical protein
MWFILQFYPRARQSQLLEEIAIFIYYVPLLVSCLHLAKQSGILPGTFSAHDESFLFPFQSPPVHQPESDTESDNQEERR